MLGDVLSESSDPTEENPPICSSRPHILEIAGSRGRTWLGRAFRIIHFNSPQVWKLRPRDGDGFLGSPPHFTSLSWPSVHGTGHPHATPLCQQHLNNLEFVS